MAETPDNPKQATDSRWQLLAGLRFLLAMVVVSTHLTWFAPLNSPPPMLAMLGGTAAVLGFLIVSGYSIGHSLQRRPRGFFQRRLLRIYPLYFCAVLYALVPFRSGASALETMSPFVIIARPHWYVVLGNLLVMQNLICPPIDSNTLLWTLGIEMICYAFAPLFRKAPSILLMLLIAISGSAFGWWYPHLVRQGVLHYANLMWGLPLLMFLWAWLAGFWLQRSGNSIWTAMVIIAIVVVLLHFNTEQHTPYSTGCVIGSVLIVTFAPLARLNPRLGAILDYLGDLSYPLYLFHLPTLLIGYCIMGIDNITVLLMMALAISAAFLFIESFAKPIITRSWSRDAVPTPG
jgi:peptidoglycan/LPS O-acetylase OafA/YrhL